MSRCKRISFEMEESGNIWYSDLDMNDADEVMVLSELLPETGQEKITVVIIRTTKHSQEYSAYLKSINPYKAKKV